MNFAKGHLVRGELLDVAVDIKIPKKSTEYFSLKRVKTDEGIPINLSLILLPRKERPLRPRLPCENR